MARNTAIALVVVGLAALGGAYFFLSGTDKQASSVSEEREANPKQVLGRLAPLVPPTDCTIKGSVVEKASASPVADAIVILVHTPTTDSISTKLVDAAGPITARTDETGAWEINHVPSGVYEVSASLPQHVPDSRTKVVCGDEVNFELAPGGALLSGQVTDVGGGPIAGVLMVAGWADGSGATWSDSDGQYEMHLAPNDSYWVRAISADYVESDRTINVAGPTTLNFELVPSGSIRGTVLNGSSREPVANAVILQGAGSFGRGPEAVAQSSADGTFELTGLSSGAIELRAVTRGVSSRDATVVELSIAEQRDGVEILVDEAFSIRGRVVLASDETSGVAGMTVEAAQGGGGVMARFSRASISALGPSSEDGSFEIIGLQPNSYELAARGDAALSSSGTSVEISDSDVDDIVISVALGVTVTGRVEPPGVTRIRLKKDGEFGLADLASSSIFDSASTKSNEDGTFELEHVADGNFLAIAKAASGDEGTSKLSVSGENVDGLVIKLESRGSVSGIVVNTEGEPVGEKWVSVAVKTEGDEDKEPWRAMRRSSSGSNSAADGSFRVGGLEDGTYTVHVGEPMDLVAPKPEKSVSVTVESHSDVTGIRLTVEVPDGEITGIVRDGDGSPLADSWVTLKRRRDLPPAIKKQFEKRGEMDPEMMNRFYSRVSGRTPALTGPDGRFVLRGLAEGTYAVTADAPGGAGREHVYDVALGDNVEVVIRSLGGLSGIVTAQDSPVKVYDLKVSGPTDSSVHVVNEEGRYGVSRLEAGSYTISVRTQIGSASKTVEVEAGKIAETNIAIESWSSLRGRVVNAETGTPLAGLVVFIYGSERADMFSANPPQTDAKGAFRVERLSAGPGQLSLMGGDIMTNLSAGGFNSVGRAEYVLTPGEELDLGVVQALAPKTVDSADRGTLGLTVKGGPTADEPEPSDRKNDSAEDIDDFLWVEAVEGKGPADRAGIEVGDQITKVGGFTVGESGGTIGQMMLDSRRLEAKESVALTLRRGQKEWSVELVADAAPE